MAVHNAKETVEKAIESIVNQTYLEWNMVIVDDYSTDGTYNLLLDIAESDLRISVLRNDYNKGLAASLNLGLLKTNGKFIARMDGDDISFPSRLEKQISFLLANPGIDVVGSGAELIGSNGELQNVILLPEHHTELEKCILEKSIFFNLDSTSILLK